MDGPTNDLSRIQVEEPSLPVENTHDVETGDWVHVCGVGGGQVGHVADNGVATITLLSGVELQLPVSHVGTGAYRLLDSHGEPEEATRSLATHEAD